MTTIEQITEKLSPGTAVQLKTDEGIFDGIFKQIEDGIDCIEVELIKCYHMKKELPGVQSFALSSIESIVTQTSKNREEINIKNLKLDKVKLTDNDEIPADMEVHPPAITKDRPVIIRRNEKYPGVSHLGTLHTLRIPELLDQIQMEDPVPLKTQKKGSGALEIPQPEQDAEHMEGAKFKNRHSHEFTAARKYTWKDSSQPPEIHCPSTLFVIKDTENVMFSKAIEHLYKTRTIGVSLEGQFLGRHGKLSLISFATPEKIYMFDIVAIGDRCFDMGLRKILEDSDIQKVFHDVRQPSDILYHKYKVTLKNVDDTLVTHTLFTCQSIYAGYLPKYAVSVSNLARAYLGIKGSHLYFPHYRQQNLKADTEIWMERPLKEHIIMNALRNVMYLLELRYFTKKAYSSFHRNAVDVLLSHVRDGDDLHAEVVIYDGHVIPKELEHVLPEIVG